MVEGSPPPRSWLFVPGDSERKLAKIADSGADAVIIDLEDAVAPGRKTVARALAIATLGAMDRRTAPALWVRINISDDRWDDAELADVVAAGPAGIMVPKARDAAMLRRIAAAIDALSGPAGGPPIATFPVATETPQAVLALSSYGEGAVPRMAALTWGAEDLGAALGMSVNRRPDGQFRGPFQIVRSLALMAAKAAGVQAVETLHADFRDLEGLSVMAAEAAADGFTGQLAIHPAQVAVINAAFVPTARQVEHARNVVAAFAGAEDGAVALDGQMLDRPHLKAAEAMLERAVAYGSM